MQGHLKREAVVGTLVPVYQVCSRKMVLRELRMTLYPDLGTWSRPISYSINREVDPEFVE
jgi:hypothetical protein